jgi:rRNA maturation protein Nop10
VEDNKTDGWTKNSNSTRYNLPTNCPKCGDNLKLRHIYVGIFPYIHSDVTFTCCSNENHKFAFCLPYNKNMTFGYLILDTTEAKRYYTTKRLCPFDGETLQPYRLWGDLVFNDGTKKLQLRCPECFYSERVTFK